MVPPPDDQNDLQPDDLISYQASSSSHRSAAANSQQSHSQKSSARLDFRRNKKLKTAQILKERYQYDLTQGDLSKQFYIQRVE